MNLSIRSIANGYIVQNMAQYNGSQSEQHFPTFSAMLDYIKSLEPQPLVGNPDIGFGGVVFCDTTSSRL